MSTADGVSPAKSESASTTIGRGVDGNFLVGTFVGFGLSPSTKSASGFLRAVLFAPCWAAVRRRRLCLFGFGGSPVRGAPGSTSSLSILRASESRRFPLLRGAFFLLGAFGFGGIVVGDFGRADGFICRGFCSPSSASAIFLAPRSSKPGFCCLAKNRCMRAFRLARRLLRLRSSMFSKRSPMSAISLAIRRATPQPQERPNLSVI